jgi:hypothetical protein
MLHSTEPCRIIQYTGTGLAIETEFREAVIECHCRFGGNSCYVFARLMVQISALRPTIMTEGFHVLPWLLNAVSGTVYQIRP